MKAPGELRLTNATTPDGEPILEGEPDIVGLAETRYATGYAVKKGLNYEMRDDGSSDTIGAIIFRAVEAYINYIEASYLLIGSIEGKADQYWRAAVGSAVAVSSRGGRRAPAGLARAPSAPPSSPAVAWCTAPPPGTTASAPRRR